MLRTHEEKQVFSEKIIQFLTAFGSKCLQLIKYQKLLITCAPISELPSNIRTQSQSGFINLLNKGRGGLLLVYNSNLAQIFCLPKSCSQLIQQRKYAVIQYLCKRYKVQVFKAPFKYIRLFQSQHKCDKTSMFTLIHLFIFGCSFLCNFGQTVLTSKYVECL